MNITSTRIFKRRGVLRVRATNGKSKTVNFVTVGFISTEIKKNMRIPAAGVKERWWDVWDYFSERGWL